LGYQTPHIFWGRRALAASRFNEAGGIFSEKKEVGPPPDPPVYLKDR
jgi:hypothetical protein